MFSYINADHAEQMAAAVAKRTSAAVPPVVAVSLASVILILQINVLHILAAPGKIVINIYQH